MGWRKKGFKKVSAPAQPNKSGNTLPWTDLSKMGKNAAQRFFAIVFSPDCRTLFRQSLQENRNRWAAKTREVRAARGGNNELPDGDEEARSEGAYGYPWDCGLRHAHGMLLGVVLCFPFAFVGPSFYRRAPPGSSVYMITRRSRPPLGEESSTFTGTLVSSRLIRNAHFHFQES
jgi:hypothetical protein